MKQIEVVAAIIRKGDKIFATQRGYGECTIAILCRIPMEKQPRKRQ